MKIVITKSEIVAMSRANIVTNSMFGNVKNALLTDEQIWKKAGDEFSKDSGCRGVEAYVNLESITIFIDPEFIVEGLSLYGKALQLALDFSKEIIKTSADFKAKWSTPKTSTENK